MSGWLDEYGAELAHRLDDAPPGLRLDDGQIEAILGLAAVVAHNTERKNAPVAAYLAGYFAALRPTGDGLAMAVALAEEMLVGE